MLFGPRQTHFAEYNRKHTFWASPDVLWGIRPKSRFLTLARRTFWNTTEITLFGPRKTLFVEYDRNHAFWVSTDKLREYDRNHGFRASSEALRGIDRNLAFWASPDALRGTRLKSRFLCLDRCTSANTIEITPFLHRQTHFGEYDRNNAVWASPDALGKYDEITLFGPRLTHFAKYDRNHVFCASPDELWGIRPKSRFLVLARRTFGNTTEFTVFDLARRTLANTSEITLFGPRQTHFGEYDRNHTF